MGNRVWQKIDSKTICYGGTWSDVQSTIRASVFGVMLELAQDRVKHYKSDLYHDATWLAEQITCPMSFDWVARESGTFIGDSASSFRLDEWDKSAKYRFELLNEGNARWVLNIHEAVLIPVPVVARLCGECGYKGAEYVDHMQMWLCSDYCAVVADTRLSERNQGQIIEKVAIEDFALPNVPDTVQSSPGSALWLQNPDSIQIPLDPYMGETELGGKDPGCDVCGMHDRSEPCSLVKRFCNEDPLPENVVKALVNTDVNPINWTPEKVVEIVNKYDAENSLNPYAEMNAIHEALPIGECELATTAAGCIYHSAPPISKFRTYTDAEKIAIAEATFPTLRNDSTVTDTIHKDGNRKVINMDSILRELREKLDEANNARDEAYDAKSQLDDAIGEFDEYIDEMDNLISSLDNLPSISVDLDVRVEFDS